MGQTWDEDAPRPHPQVAAAPDHPEPEEVARSASLVVSASALPVQSRHTKGGNPFRHPYSVQLSRVPWLQILF